MTPEFLRQLVREIHDEPRPLYAKGKREQVQAILDRHGLDLEWDIPLRALTTGASSKEVLKWAKGEKQHG